MQRKPTRAIGYARVSSAEQAIGTSLQDQQDVIKAYANQRGIRVDRIYVEAQSAVHEKIERREQIRALLADVRRDDIVLVDKLDRWSRDAEFSYRSVREILAVGAHFYAIGEACDPSTSEGDTALGFRILFAREEHKRIKQRMVGTRKKLRDAGYYAEGLPPWGYLRQNVKGAERNALIVDDAEVPNIHKAFRLCIDGMSLTGIAEKIGVSRDRVRDAMRSRLYLGEALDSHGTWIQGRQPPIVDPETFLDAQAALSDRRYGSRPPTHDAETADWWLREIARCGLCGAKMSAVYGGTPSSRRYYYGCSGKCTSRLVRVDAVEPACIPIVGERLVELRSELAAAKIAEGAKSVDLNDVEERTARIKRRRERYAEAYADGAMTREELRAAMAKLDVERTKLEAIVRVAPRASDHQRQLALRDVETVRARWQEMSPRKRRAIVWTLARTVRIAAGHEALFEWRTSEEIALGKE